MTERFENPHHDSRMHSHNILLRDLKDRVNAVNYRMKVIWGRRPTLLLGGIVQLHDVNRQPHDHTVAVSRYAWATPTDPQYDVHIFNDARARRYAVYGSGIYIAQNMGRLTTDSLVREARVDTAYNLSKLIRSTDFTPATADVAHAQLAGWDILELPASIDQQYPDLGVYHYTEILKEEQISTDE